MVVSKESQYLVGYVERRDLNISLGEHTIYIQEKNVKHKKVKWLGLQ